MTDTTKMIANGTDAADQNAGASPSTRQSDTAQPTMGRDAWNRRYATQAFVWSVEPNRLFADEVADLPPGRALDLAAGEGRNALWLAESGWTVCAVDFADEGLAKGRLLATDRQVERSINFIPADLRDYEPEAQGYDLVALIYLQVPQIELIPILKQAAQAVAPGGTFLLIAHDSTNLTQGYGGPQNPALLYTAEQVATAIGGELTIEKALRVARPVKTAEGTKFALDCLVRATRPR